MDGRFLLSCYCSSCLGTAAAASCLLHLLGLNPFCRERNPLNHEPVEKETFLSILFILYVLLASTLY